MANNMNLPPPGSPNESGLQVAQELLGWLLTVLLVLVGGFLLLSGQWQNGGVLLAFVVRVASRREDVAEQIALITYPLNRLPEWARLLMTIPAGLYLFSVTLD